jgi:hypothetical protein
MMQWGSRDDIRLRRKFMNADASHKIYLNEKKWKEESSQQRTTGNPQEYQPNIPKICVLTRGTLFGSNPSILT